MDRRDFLKMLRNASLAAPVATVVRRLPLPTTASAGAYELHSAQFIADKERASVQNYYYSTFALIVDRTDTTITVQTCGESGPIFTEDGVVSIRSLICTDRDLFVRETWLTVHNYRPNDDGSQTWDIEILRGDISDVIINTVAYHYGPAATNLNLGETDAWQR
jgi:hypothetical protein